MKILTLPDSEILDNDYELNGLRDYGVEVVAYNYTSMPYEGQGPLIFRHNKLWKYHDMGHCSCYGPTDHIEYSQKGYKTLSELKEFMSSELDESCLALFKLLKSKRYK